MPGSGLLLLHLDVLAQPGETFEDTCGFCSLVLLSLERDDFWASIPSPLVAQLGSTFHTWSLAILSRSRACATSFGRMAVI